MNIFYRSITFATMACLAALLGACSESATSENGAETAADPELEIA